MKKPDLIEWIRQDHEQLGQSIELLDRCVFHLRFEGKKHDRENILRIKDHVRFLHGDMGRRIQYEEKIIFPFLVMHIPRFEPLCNLLHTDHKQFESEFMALTSSVASGSKPEILTQGDHLLGSLRSHWLLEGTGAIAPLHHELKSHEKKQLDRLWGKVE